MMTDHVHEWYFSSASGIFQCKKPRCIVGMGFLRAADELNEHAKMQKYIEETCDEDFVMWCREQDALKEGG